MCKIDFSTTFLNKSFPHWLYDMLFVYGDVVYAVISFLQDEPQPCSRSCEDEQDTKQYGPIDMSAEYHLVQGLNRFSLL